MKEVLLKILFAIICFSPWWVTIIIVELRAALRKEDEEDVGW